jgi:hypothetical protein
MTQAEEDTADIAMASLVGISVQHLIKPDESFALKSLWYWHFQEGKHMGSGFESTEADAARAALAKYAEIKP